MFGAASVCPSPLISCTGSPGPAGLRIGGLRVENGPGASDAVICRSPGVGPAAPLVQWTEADARPAVAVDPRAASGVGCGLAPGGGRRVPGFLVLPSGPVEAGPHYRVAGGEGASRPEY